MMSVSDGCLAASVPTRPQTSAVAHHGRAPAADRGDRDRHDGATVHRVLDRGVHAEDVDILERVITAEVAGTFFPAFAAVSADEPGIVAAGDEIGTVVQGGEKHVVLSPFTGVLMGMLALPGERVRAHQPVAWLTTEDGV